jgi:hypothetical protein
MTASSSSSPQRQHRGRAWASRWTAPRDDENDADRRSHRASAAARRPTRLALARLADSIVDATASVARAPTRLFDVALKCVARRRRRQSRARAPNPYARRNPLSDRV